MMKLSDIVAATVDVELGDDIYTLSPLRDRDYGDFERWMQDRLISIAKRNMADLSPEDKNRLLSEAIKQANLLTFHSPAAYDIMVTIEGAAYLAFLSMRQHHPDLTPAKVLDLCTDARVLQQMMDKVDLLNSEDVPPETPKKKAP